MKVILAGYPKTGTKTMNEALSMLGYNVFDFMEHWWHHGDHWLKLFTTGGTVEDFKKMYEDVDAVVDFPAYFFWEEIHQAFPDAKIILTIRDEDSWYKSFIRQQRANESNNISKTLGMMAASTRLNPYTMLRFHHFLQKGLRIVLGAEMGQPGNELVDKMHYRRHNNYVLQAAPKEKLLLFNISDGWGSLCSFLGKDVPDVPFPHKNRYNSVADDVMKENPIAIDNISISKFRCKIFFCVIAVGVALYFGITR